MAPAIEICGLEVAFPSPGGGCVQALRGISLAIEAGQVYGFLGPNVAGKTTAIQVLLGFQAPAAGSVRLFGEDAGRPASRRRLGYLPEHSSQYPFLTGRETLIQVGRLFGLRRRAAAARAAELLALLGLEPAADRRLAAYSRGMLQRIGLAQALVNDPDLLILDEPTNGFDPLGRLQVRELMAALRARGKTLFFSSHELSEAERVCDRIGILSAGRLVAEGRLADLVKAGESLEQYFIRVTS